MVANCEFVESFNCGRFGDGKSQRFVLGHQPQYVRAPVGCGLHDLHSEGLVKAAWSQEYRPNVIPVRRCAQRDRGYAPRFERCGNNSNQYECPNFDELPFGWTACRECEKSGSPDSLWFRAIWVAGDGQGLKNQQNKRQKREC